MRPASQRMLGLEAAWIEDDEHGFKTNEFLQTSQPHIYAAGDITNRLKFTHTADFTARTVIRNILMPLPFLGQKMNFSGVPWCTYTEPEVAHVGLGKKARGKRMSSMTSLRSRSMRSIRFRSISSLFLMTSIGEIFVGVGEGFIFFRR
ncbi:MAG: FAD-dependent oxidoreductase [Chthoniobacterales bacterium]